MKNVTGAVKAVGVIAALLIGLLCCYQNTMAYSVKDDGRIKNGVYAGDIDLSGMNEQQAKAAVEKYITDISDGTIELQAVDGNSCFVPASELGISWKNPEIINQAVSTGRFGNIIKRYKDVKNLSYEKKVFDIELGFDQKAIEEVISQRCTIYDRPAKDAALTREGGSFNIIPGENGEAVDVKASASLVKTYMERLWSRGDTGRVELTINESEPRGKAEDLEQITDVLGTYTTSFSTSAKGRSANVRNGCSHINGTLLYPGEQLSVYEKVSPFTEENGYYLAGSYNNGIVVETLGGGICQVSSTLYNAVIRAELQVNERSPHSMVVSYVDLSADAAISGTSKDFKFTNSTEYPIYISGVTTDDKKITFTIYGHETRPKDRTLSFESEMLTETVPEGEKLVADPSQSVGYVTTQSAHTGYTANYWKIIKENGQEVERVKLNSSTYMPAPKTITFGTAGDATGALSSAIQSESGDYCKALAANLVNAASAASVAAASDAANEAAAQAED